MSLNIQLERIFMKNKTTLLLSLFFISLLHANQEPTQERIQVVFRQGAYELIKQNPLKYQNEQQLLENLAISLHVASQEKNSKDKKQLIDKAQEILSVLAKTGTTKAREKAFALAESYNFIQTWNEQHSFLNVCSDNIKMLAMATPNILNIAESSGIAYRKYQDTKDSPYEHVHANAGMRALDWRPQGRKIGVIASIGVGSAYQPKALAQDDYLQLIPLAAQLAVKLFGWEERSLQTPNQIIGIHSAKATLNVLAVLPVAYHVYAEMYKPYPLDKWKENLEKDKERETNPQAAFSGLFNLDPNHVGTPDFTGQPEAFNQNKS